MTLQTKFTSPFHLTTTRITYCHHIKRIHYIIFFLTLYFSLLFFFSVSFLHCCSILSFVHWLSCNAFMVIGSSPCWFFIWWTTIIVWFLVSIIICSLAFSPCQLTSYCWPIKQLLLHLLAWAKTRSGAPCRRFTGLRDSSSYGKLYSFQSLGTT